MTMDQSNIDPVSTLINKSVMAALLTKYCTNTCYILLIVYSYTSSLYKLLG